MIVEKVFTKEIKNNIISDKYNPLNYESEGLFMKGTKDIVKNETMKKLIITKEDFKNYFKEKNIISREEYKKYLEIKNNT